MKLKKFRFTKNKKNLQRTHSTGGRRGSAGMYRMAGNLGYEVFIIDDATVTFDRKGVDGTKYPAELIHAVSLANLHEEFGTVVSSKQMIELISS